MEIYKWKCMVLGALGYIDIADFKKLMTYYMCPFFDFSERMWHPVRCSFTRTMVIS